MISVKAACKRELSRGGSEIREEIVESSQREKRRTTNTCIFDFLLGFSLCTLWQRFELVAKVEDSALTYLSVCAGGHHFLLYQRKEEAEKYIVALVRQTPVHVRVLECCTGNRDIFVISRVTRKALSDFHKIGDGTLVFNQNNQIVFLFQSSKIYLYYIV